MKLSTEDTKLFFELMWNLQWYVNREIGLFPTIKTVAAYEKDLDFKDKVTVRQRLFAEPEWIDKFINANPCQLSTDKLEIIAGWKKFVAGDFYIERYLKNYTIFIGDDKVYAVLSLYEALSDIIHKSHLPMLVKTVLIPFKGQIIYDGVFHHYSVQFGGGIRSRLKETYMGAKQNGTIIESLDTPPSAPQLAAPNEQQQQQVELQNLLVAFAEKAAKLRGGGGLPPIYSPLFSLLRASIDLVQTAVENPEDTRLMQKKHDKTETALRKVETAIWRI